MRMTIQSRSHPYEVLGAENLADEFRALREKRQATFLVDAQVRELYGKSLFRDIPEAALFTIKATEEAKSYEKLPPAFVWLLESGFQRRSHLVVIGGGVLQDIGCFIASVLFRGVEWTLVPTTLLAQCDSCIGSKSSLNIASYKNQLGTFYPPHRILLDPSFLTTLPEIEILGGLGEAIKLHLIEGEASLSCLREKLVLGLPAGPVLTEIIWDSLAIKQRFIEEDELDRGVRNLLNYGHTFAHAYETATHYAIPHGIAVSLGVVSATYFSERIDWVPLGTAAELLRWLRPYLAGCETTLQAVSRDDILQAMRRDKKNQGDDITFILTRGPGRMEKRALPIAQARDLLTDLLGFFS
jgi:3-dehydroquinate synthase